MAVNQFEDITLERLRCFKAIFQRKFANRVAIQSELDLKKVVRKCILQSVHLIGFLRYHGSLSAFLPRKIVISVLFATWRIRH